VTGYQVEQIFWRFPIRVIEGIQQAGASDENNDEDQYARDATIEFMKREDYKVEELSSG
jgi:hypothetical protein